MKLGDTVILKSGGPPMTISSINATKSEARCVWHDGDQIQSESFPFATLSLTEKKKDLNGIYVVIDKSGSMSSLRSDTIGGYNSFIKEQQEQPGAAKLTTVFFNHNVDRPWEKLVDLKSARELDSKNYRPNGTTALHDAIGSTINRAKQDAKDQGFTKVTLMVMTDGFENQSKEYSQADVNVLVKEAEDELGWDVFFVGANIDVRQTSETYGMKSHKVVDVTSYARSGQLDAAYVGLSRGVTRSRAQNFDASVGLESLVADAVDEQAAE